MPSANANYSFNPWMKDMPIQVAQPNYNSQDDQLRYEALLSQFAMGPEQIRQIRPTVGNEPFPPRFGYERRQPTIMDALTISQQTLVRDTPTRQDTGQPGSSGPSLGAW